MSFDAQPDRGRQEPEREICPTCREEMDGAPNVEAFELTGVICCDDCAEAVIENAAEDAAEDAPA